MMGKHKHHNSDKIRILKTTKSKNILNLKIYSEIVQGTTKEFSDQSIPPNQKIDFGNSQAGKAFSTDIHNMHALTQSKSRKHLS